MHTDKDDNYIRNNYLVLPAMAIAKNLGRPESTIRVRYKTLGLVVPDDIKKSFQSRGRFKKGHTPINKGLKQSEYMSPEGMERSKQTEFKKGNKRTEIYSCSRIASGLARSTGNKVIKELQQEYLKNPELIKLKRQQLMLQKEIRNHDRI